MGGWGGGVGAGESIARSDRERDRERKKNKAGSHAFLSSPVLEACLACLFWESHLEGGGNECGDCLSCPECGAARKWEISLQG